jgi:uncharacterized membrane protein YeaQ/YmgE (transglycosylase-associated protein family)
MGVLSWTVAGLLGVALTKLVLPRDGPGGWLGPAAVGIVAAVVGGWAWSLVFHSGSATGLHMGSILIACVSGVVALLKYDAIVNKPPA